MRRAVVLVVATTLGALGTLTAPARADDDLAEARRLEASLDYAGALTVAERVIARGGADPSRLAELHLLAGRLAAGLDRRERAEDHFARALALRPDVTLPAGTSPKLTGPFDVARVRALPLRLHATANQGLVTLHLDADALGLVAGIGVHVVDAAGAHQDLTARAATRLAIPAHTTAIEVAALDNHGNRVWAGAPLAAVSPTITPASPGRDTPARGPRRAAIARWPVWTAATTVALAAGGLAGWQVTRAQDDWDRLRDSGTADYSDLAAVETRGTRWALAANVAFGLGTLTAITALVLYTRGDHLTVSPAGIQGRF